MDNKDTRLKIYSVIGWIFFLFPLVVMILWIISVYSGSTEIERAVIFKNYFPEFMTQNKIIPITSTVFSLISVIFCTMGLKVEAKGMTIINIFVIIIALLVFVLNIFSFL